MKPVVFVRSAYNYDVDEASLEAGQGPGDEPSRTQQSFKDECDINEIVRKFGLTGEIPGDFKVPVSGDFTDVMDFQSALNAVMAAEAEFMKLPGEVRARFQNDPQALLAFVEDDKNRDEARKLGLLKEPPPRDAVQAIDELAKAVKDGGAKAAP